MGVLLVVLALVEIGIALLLVRARETPEKVVLLVSMALVALAFLTLSVLQI